MKTTEKISQDLKLDRLYIEKILSKSQYYYKDYFIQKSNGEKRRISQPSPELKSFQYWVVKNILSKYKVSASAFAYKKGDSIKKHAAFHLGSKYIFHTDIRNFFGSISPLLLINALKENDSPIKDMSIDIDDFIYCVQKICFRNNKLCIGSVSSPSISNIVMLSFDETIMDFCDENGLKYSRYADDIYISSEKYISIDLSGFISKQLLKLGLTMNKRKTWYCSSKNRQLITGLTLTSDHKSITIGKQYKNLIKKLIYNKLIHNTGDPLIIMGYLSYLKQVEPYAYNKLITKYSKYTSNDIIKEIMNLKLN